VSNLFLQVLKARTGLEAVPEYRFHPVRRWRFDYCIPHLKIAIEQEGAVWTSGRHTRGSGYVKDMEKYNTAAAMGYTVLRFTPQQLMSTQALDLIKEAATIKAEKGLK
jgi:very-short-patch-repair endonuclease